MKRKLGIVASCLRNDPQIESLEKIKAAGFDGFFTSRGDIAECCAMRKEADRLGLDYQFIHAPFKGINTFRTPGLDYLPLYTQVENVGFCFDNGHEYCYTPKVKFINLYPDRMICICSPLTARTILGI